MISVSLQLWQRWVRQDKKHPLLKLLIPRRYPYTVHDRTFVPTVAAVMTGICLLIYISAILDAASLTLIANLIRIVLIPAVIIIAVMMLGGLILAPIMIIIGWVYTFQIMQAVVKTLNRYADEILWTTTPGREGILDLIITANIQRYNFLVWGIYAGLDAHFLQTTSIGFLIGFSQLQWISQTYLPQPTPIIVWVQIMPLIYLNMLLLVLLLSADFRQQMLLGIVLGIFSWRYFRHQIYPAALASVLYVITISGTLFLIITPSNAFFPYVRSMFTPLDVANPYANVISVLYMLIVYGIVLLLRELVIMGIWSRFTES